MSFIYNALHDYAWIDPINAVGSGSLLGLQFGERTRNSSRHVVFAVRLPSEGSVYLQP